MGPHAERSIGLLAHLQNTNCQRVHRRWLVRERTSPRRLPVFKAKDTTCGSAAFSEARTVAPALRMTGRGAGSERGGGHTYLCVSHGSGRIRLASAERCSSRRMRMAEGRGAGRLHTVERTRAQTDRGPAMEGTVARPYQEAEHARPASWSAAARGAVRGSCPNPAPTRVGAPPMHEISENPASATADRLEVLGGNSHRGSSSPLRTVFEGTTRSRRSRGGGAMRKDAAAEFRGERRSLPATLAEPAAAVCSPRDQDEALTTPLTSCSAFTPGVEVLQQVLAPFRMHPGKDPTTRPPVAHAYEDSANPFLVKVAAITVSSLRRYESELRKAAVEKRKGSLEP